MRQWIYWSKGMRWVTTALVIALFGAFLTACSSLPDSANTLQPLEQTKIYLVRHAEKQDGSSDPDLTAAGRERAVALSDVLGNTAVQMLWSSNYARTRQTLAPLSERQQIPVTLYDAHDSAALVTTILEGYPGQTHVVAGHSNTVPQLVDLLEAWPNTTMSSTPRPNLGHDEYDRLYVVTVISGQPVIVEELRY